MKNSIILFLFLIPTFLFAQYPTTGNKSRLGWQTTGDGLIWRGVAGDTVNKPNNRNYPYFQLDTVNAVLYRYIATQGNWQAVGGGSIDIDSLVYATRFWVNSNFFPLQGGLLTGTGGSGFVGFPLQSSPPATPATGFSLYAGSTGNNISWMQPDGFFRRLVSPVTGTPRQYQFMARSYTLADSADVAALPTGTGTTNYYAKWSSANALTIGNLFDNNTAVSILNSKPFLLGQWTTAGRPSGVTGYMGYNTTTAFTEGYFTSQWENYITSTGASTSQVPYYLSAGKIAGDAGMTWENTNKGLSLVSSSTAQGRGLIVRQTNSGIQAAPIQFEKIRGASAVQNGDLIGAFTLRGYSGTQYVTDNALFGGLVTGTVTSSSVPTSIFFNAGSATGNYNTHLLVHSNGTVGIGEFGSIVSGASIVAPSNLLHVRKTVAGGYVTSQTENLSSTGYTSFLNTNNLGYTSRFIKWGSAATTYKTITANSTAIYNSSEAGKISLLNDFATGVIDFAAGGSSTAQLTLASTGNLLIGTTTDVTGYQLNIVGTGAISLPRGTVAQRPTIAASTTPFRYNTDSTALEYGESVGTWRQLATRAYARSLDTWLGTRLAAGNVRIDANANTFTIDTLTRFLVSATNHTAEFGTAQIAQVKKLNAAGTKYYDNYRQYDSRSSIANGTNVNVGPSYSELFIYNRGGGEEYEWTDMHVLDTANNVFGHMYGARYKDGFSAFRAIRPSSGTAYRLTPSFDFLQFATGNGATGANVLGVRVGTDSLFSVKQNGSIEADKYGAGNKEAADLSKTVSAYASVYATDGTLLEYPLADLGGSSILDSLPNGSISIDANGNSLNISNLDELTFTGYSADIRGQNSRLLLDDDDATLSADNNIDISAAGELTLTGLVVALQEAYYEVTSTTSPDTLSSVYSDNLINQGSTQATFTLVLPPSPIDGQVCTITYVNNITTLTLDGNGTTVIGSAVTTGVPGSQRKYKYYAAAGAWVKIY